ncbi:BAR domain-containing protein [Clostridium tetani]|uniref:Uncharacterized protein n=1 Tax=Clostridium tetani TaxID=1513 RepID=A0A4Q0VGM3_CLOTA|nr:hypothetical protein [Clostridium tetani]RXI44230.1 hypothetical protein DP126_12115 [Clostridium tetani]RXI50713.1 hypothetical protein DP130_01745 [Clostridium tetani]RXM59385.1 hypothetical protein DP138_13850 [Clostridium tetani]RXM65103.1 hypothetical protein DP145_11120 [Clostridium tetani]BDR66750.1 hypothetical protein K144312032_09780 [Clostridium tetani]
MNDENFNKYKEKIVYNFNKYKKHIFAGILSLSLIGNLSAYPYVKNSKNELQVVNTKIEQYKEKVSLSDSYKQQLDKLKATNAGLNDKTNKLEKEKLNLQESNKKLQESNKKLEETNKGLTDSINKIKQESNNRNTSTTNTTNSAKKQGHIVYITATGGKYHGAGCRYLSRSCYEIDISEAKAQGYTSCSRCSP